MNPMQRPPDEHFSAWLDGELAPAEREAVDAWLRDHPEDAARLQLWAADRDALRARFGPVVDEPVPASLRDAVLTRPRPAFGWARAAMAAGLLVGGALLGATVAWQVKPAGESLAQGRGGSTWTHRAAVAHAVYVPEVRHPVEVAVASPSADQQRAQEEHLARWLTKRLDMPVRLFDLRPHGFELVGGRLLPDAAGPSAQLMYQNSAGQRVTLYLRRPEAGADTAFQFRREGEVSMFFWTEAGFGCALVGTLPRERLLTLAESVYKQAEETPLMPPAKPVS